MKPADIEILPIESCIGPSKSIASIYAKDKVIGECVMDSDGLWYLSRLFGPGYTDAWVLRAIADRLDAMNADWNTKLDSAYRSGALGTPSTDRIHE